MVCEPFAPNIEAAVIERILIYFFTKTRPVEIVSDTDHIIVNACERGSFYSILFSDGEYVQYPIQHIYCIKAFRKSRPS